MSPIYIVDAWNCLRNQTRYNNELRFRFRFLFIKPIWHNCYFIIKLIAWLLFMTSGVPSKLDELLYGHIEKAISPGK